MPRRAGSVAAVEAFAPVGPCRTLISSGPVAVINRHKFTKWVDGTAVISGSSRRISRRSSRRRCQPQPRRQPRCRNRRRRRDSGSRYRYDSGSGGGGGTSLGRWRMCRRRRGAAVDIGSGRSAGGGGVGSVGGVASGGCVGIPPSGGKVPVPVGITAPVSGISFYGITFSAPGGVGGNGTPRAAGGRAGAGGATFSKCTRDPVRRLAVAPGRIRRLAVAPGRIRSSPFSNLSPVF